MAERSSSTRKVSESETETRAGGAPDGGLFPAKGERALSIGKTGSGKTMFNRWLLERLPDAPVIVYDTKHDRKFDDLPGGVVATSMEEAEAAIDHLGTDYVIIRPPPLVTANPGALDRILMHHEEFWRGMDAYIDEIYHFHSSGRAGPGLNGLYTRGRARGITTIASTQRPAWVSGFVFSETNLFYVFRLTRDKDKKNVNDFIPEFSELPTAPKFNFYAWREDGDAAPKLMKPVPIAEGEKSGYTDHVEDPKAANSGSDVAEAERGPTIWI